MINRHNDEIVVAIDGPSASGKSTVARILASRFGFFYVDSGSIYRAVTYATMRNGIKETDGDAICEMIKDGPIDFAVSGNSIKVRVNGVEAGPEIRTEEVNQRVSLVAAHACVREKVVEWLRSMKKYGPLVMEGRDIGTVVFPETHFKFFLDASPNERAKRRFLESEMSKSVKEVADSLTRRDKIDSSRAVAPLKAAETALKIDTTSMDAESVADLIEKKIKEIFQQNPGMFK